MHSKKVRKDVGRDSRRTGNVKLLALFYLIHVCALLLAADIRFGRTRFLITSQYLCYIYSF